jgi:hypothetical protein
MAIIRAAGEMIAKQGNGGPAVLAPISRQHEQATTGGGLHDEEGNNAKQAARGPS